MASRELKAEEAEQLASTAIAMDGIAVIVSNENPTDVFNETATAEIYTGETTVWSGIAQ